MLCMFNRRRLERYEATQRRLEHKVDRLLRIAYLIKRAVQPRHATRIVFGTVSREPDPQASNPKE